MFRSKSTSKTPSMTPNNTTKVKMLEMIGSGGFGKVFKCMYKNKKHVVKQVPVSSSTYSFQTVLAEFEILSNIKHPRILRMIDFYQTSTDFNFVLEYMENGNLRETFNQYLENNWKFGQDDLLKLFMDIVAGVWYLHSSGIIHRDLKPENILLDENHRLKIADFGVSKFLSADASKPQYQTCTGTIIYMAPEVFLHKPYDRSADVWALGIIFYEMAMLKYPFSQADKTRILNPKLTFTPPKIDYKRRNYAAGVQEMLNTMLQKDPKKRLPLILFCEFPLVRRIYEQLKREEIVYFR